jgi:phosphatidylcholine synthase
MYEDRVGKHAAVRGTFIRWGSSYEWAIRKATANHSRLLLHISTASGQHAREVISPGAIAHGNGDGFLLSFNRRMARYGAPVYLRWLGEMNNCDNAYSSRRCDGSLRNAAHSPRKFKQAWRRAVLIVRGGDVNFRRAFMLMMVATAIDATDGWFARHARVKEVLPEFDGRALDDLIDFHTYTSLPILLLWRAGTLPGALAWLLLLPLLASAYGFSQTNAKTDDGFFLGFPSYWNIIAFYVYVLQPAAWISAALIVGFTILTFVPTRYIYATRGGPYAALINIGAVVWFVMIGWILQAPPGLSTALAAVSMFYPLTYLTLSALVTGRRASPPASRGRSARSARSL